MSVQQDALFTRFYALKQWSIQGTGQIKEWGYLRSKEPVYTPQSASPAARSPLILSRYGNRKIY